jgi:hypothetical protein
MHCEHSFSSLSAFIGVLFASLSKTFISVLVASNHLWQVERILFQEVKNKVAFSCEGKTSFHENV